MYRHRRSHRGRRRMGRRHLRGMRRGGRRRGSRLLRIGYRM